MSSVSNTPWRSGRVSSKEHMNRSRLALGNEAAELAWRAGASLSLERAVDEALAAPRAPIIGDQDPADSTEDQG